MWIYPNAFRAQHTFLTMECWYLTDIFFQLRIIGLVGVAHSKIAQRAHLDKPKVRLKEGNFWAGNFPSPPMRPKWRSLWVHMLDVWLMHFSGTESLCESSPLTRNEQRHRYNKNLVVFQYSNITRIKAQLLFLESVSEGLSFTVLKIPLRHTALLKV